ncbi:MAG: sigma-54 dependent transcriptional regulator [Flavobacteriales bacterium]|jgi:transcriptional regulator with PAS, ATPase and Fis domain|nr:sigma-54 dependent transcriptional regulator [Flavobacteriales bacterium]
MNSTIQQVKQRFGIIGNSPGLNRALDVALQVAPTDISVLITGESGVGKEIIPQIIHHYSARKHNEYIAVNCGAIPEGTIDSELFGHEKGAFTGAQGSRKGYFEVANGGTIFLDETGELPLQTQVRLLRVLETGEFIKVGSSKVIKTDVRIIAATNENLGLAIQNNKFREDLFYRLSTVPITLPPLRERREDIHLLFRKFASTFADKYRMPTIRLTDEAIPVLNGYRWPGNIRQLRNLTEQISVIEKERLITPEILLKYLPKEHEQNLPSVMGNQFGTSGTGKQQMDQDLILKIIVDLKKELAETKKAVAQLLKGNANFESISDDTHLTSYPNDIIPTNPAITYPVAIDHTPSYDNDYHEPIQEHIEVEESLSLEAREKELIIKALAKHKGKRKHAAKELGISERTLYRKIKEYEITK